MPKRIFTQKQRDAQNARKRLVYAAKSKDEIKQDNLKRAFYRHDRYVNLQGEKSQQDIDDENAAKREKRATRTSDEIAAGNAKAKLKRDKPEQKQAARAYYEECYYNRTPEEIEEDKRKANMRWSTMASEEKAKRKEQALKWTAENPAKVKARQKRFRRSIKGALPRLKISAMQKDITVLLSDDEIATLMEQACHYCGHYDEELCNGLDRLNPTIREYSRANCLTCCAVCNISKHTYGYYEFLQYVYDIWLHHFDPDYHAIRYRSTKPYFSYFCKNNERREIKNDLTREEYIALVARSCNYCGALQAGGIDRCDPAVHYRLDNSVPCCGPCNFLKYTKSDKEFFAWVALVVGNLIL